jgi:hypothetical protein
LAEKLNPSIAKEIQPIVQEGKEISAVVSSIIRKTILNNK